MKKNKHVCIGEGCKADLSNRHPLTKYCFSCAKKQELARRVERKKEKALEAGRKCTNCARGPKISCTVVNNCIGFRNHKYKEVSNG